MSLRHDKDKERDIPQVKKYKHERVEAIGYEVQNVFYNTFLNTCTLFLHVSAGLLQDLFDDDQDLDAINVGVNRTDSLYL